MRRDPLGGVSRGSGVAAARTARVATGNRILGHRQTNGPSYATGTYEFYHDK